MKPLTSFWISLSKGHQLTIESVPDNLWFINSINKTFYNRNYMESKSCLVSFLNFTDFLQSMWRWLETLFSIYLWQESERKIQRVCGEEFAIKSYLENSIISKNFPDIQLILYLIYTHTIFQVNKYCFGFSLLFILNAFFFSTFSCRSSVH